jgi:hypothetical protein
VDRGAVVYVTDLKKNLFAPLSPATVEEFRAGGGTELGSGGVPGKMQAPHSSSALAVNVFDYWRDRDAWSLGVALGVSLERGAISFEQKKPTGLPGEPPNLDVVLSPVDGAVVAIESKFLEPYGHHAHGFKPKYFPEGRGVWEAAGLRACQRVAAELESGGLVYERLHAEQLLKHLLGLAQLSEPMALWYLWYDIGGAAAEQHAREVEDFATRVADDPIGFRALTYQELYRELLRTCDDEHAAYLTYLGSRYFQKEWQDGLAERESRLDRFTWHAGDVTITPPKPEPHHG